MSQLTIRGFEPELLRRLKMLAEQEGLSLNQAALVLMRRGAGLESSAATFRIGDAINKYVGVWSAAEAEEFRRSSAGFEEIDSEMWT